MTITLKKFGRLVAYSFLWVITAIVSVFIGNKKSTEDDSSSISLIPPVAEADVPTDTGCAGSAGCGASDCDTGSDSGDCCE